MREREREREREQNILQNVGLSAFVQAELLCYTRTTKRRKKLTELCFPWKLLCVCIAITYQWQYNYWSRLKQFQFINQDLWKIALPCTLSLHHLSAPVCLVWKNAYLEVRILPHPCTHLTAIRNSFIPHSYPPLRPCSKVLITWPTPYVLKVDAVNGMMLDFCFQWKAA